MNFDGYIRVSQVRGREGDSFISPDVQREQIAQWAKLRKVTIAEWHTDLDQSGAKVDRPGLTEAMRRVEASETGGIVVAKLDRFARSLTGALDTIRRLDDAGAKFVSVAEGIDPTTPSGKMLQRLMLVLAEFELDRIRESWNTAQGLAVQRGIHIASKTPTGYVRGNDRRLEPHPEYAPHVADGFRMRARGESWKAIADHLTRSGVVGPYDAPAWRNRAVQHLIANPVYLGEARSGRHTNPNAHEPLIDRATWEAAQAARGLPAARSREPALLAGLLRCAGCRYVLKPDTMKLRDGSRVRMYRCRGEHASGTCTERVAVMGRVVEPFVEQQFFALVGSLSASGLENTEDAALLVEELERAEAELVAYRDDQRIVDALGSDAFVQGLNVRANAVDRAQQALAEAGATERGTMPERATLEVMWPELDAAEKQRLLAAVIDAVMLRPGRTLPIGARSLVLARGDAPGDLPRRGRRGPITPFTWPVDGPDNIRTAAA
ncbi:MAG: recombinase family protein [Actinobacteria bacterium]|nr:recombinase family protein [Actinomycetota bacterium]